MYMLSPTVFSGLPYLLATVAAVVVGGNPIGGGLRGSVAATIIGALFLTYLGQLVLAVGFETSAQYIVQAIIIIASVGVIEVGRRIRFEWIRFKFWVTSPDVEFRIRTTFTRTMARLGLSKFLNVSTDTKVRWHTAYLRLKKRLDITP